MELLNKYAYNVTSQNGEDGIIDYIVKTLNNRLNKSFCEFGAWDGLLNSNTYRLWHDLSWEGVLIEGVREKYNDLLLNIKAFPKVISFCTYISPRGENSLDEIFRHNDIDPNIGVLSIDIDSFDYHVLKHLNYVNPQVILIENNYLLNPDFDYCDPENESQLLCSVKAIELLAIEKGYTLIACTETNTILLRNDLFDKSLFPSSTSSNVYFLSRRYKTLKKWGITMSYVNLYPIFYKKRNVFIKLFIRVLFFIFSKINRLNFKKPTASLKKHLELKNLYV